MVLGGYMEQIFHSHRVPKVETQGTSKHKTNTPVLFSDLGNLTTTQKSPYKWGWKTCTEMGF